MGIGFLASVMHLGSPLRAFNSLNRVGASALSNEIASGALVLRRGDSGGCWRYWAKCQRRWVKV
ncbi:dimethyl sulfoxide reductase anchor subunit [Klebsiella variicola subsp. variicola]|nr:dimethyl sulfoxide reductase anchor subunit [Klebsiella variicola subsp. variicola]